MVELDTGKFSDAQFHRYRTKSECSDWEMIPVQSDDVSDGMK